MSILAHCSKGPSHHGGGMAAGVAPPVPVRAMSQVLHRLIDQRAWSGVRSEANDLPTMPTVSGLPSELPQSPKICLPGGAMCSNI